MFCVLGPKRKKQENASLIYQQISITDSTLPSQCPQDSSMETPIYANPCDTSARTESSRGSASSSIKSKGQLQLSMTVQNNTLTVEVLEARYLQSKKMDNCNSYVQLQLCPDDNGSTKCQTALLTDSNCPAINEKFTYELLEEDHKKRLLLSMWNQDKHASADLMGCMSFGVRHLAARASSQPLQGWYHLLDGELGHRKHLMATPPNNTRAPAKSGKVFNKSLDSMETVTMVLQKQASGYGFTVKGSCPVKVGRVKENSASHQAGLKRGDIVVRIDGQNVQRSSAETVAKMVRHSEKQLVLDIHRPNKSANSSTMSSKLNKAINSLSDLPMDEDSENQPPAHHQRIQNNLLKNCNISSEQAFSKACSKDSLFSTVSSPFLDERRSANGSECKAKNKFNEDPSYLKWNPELSVIKNSREQQLPDLPSMLNMTGESTWLLGSQAGCSLNRTDSLSLDITSSSGSSMDMTTDSLKKSSYNTSTEGHFLTPFTPRISKKTGFDTSTEAHFLTPGSVLSQDATMLEADPREAALRAVLACEQEFVNQMQIAIQKYSRPLRAGVLSPEEHEVVFQNVEKLVAISQFHIRQLMGQSLTPANHSTASLDSTVTPQSPLGSTYLPRIQLLIDAYTSFSHGQEEAFALLEHLCTHHQTFISFMKKLPAVSASGAQELNLAQFLDYPVHHLERLTRSLQQVLEFTPSSHTDFANLCNVVEGLSFVCQSLNDSMASVV